jgi:hypothetical protein
MLGDPRAIAPDFGSVKAEIATRRHESRPGNLALNAGEFARSSRASPWKKPATVSALRQARLKKLLQQGGKIVYIGPKRAPKSKQPP